MVMMTFSASVPMMIAAQIIAGLASAGIIPTLVVLDREELQGQAAGDRDRRPWSGAGDGRQSSRFFFAGVVGSQFGWRYAFGLIIPLSAVALLLSMRR